MVESSTARFVRYLASKKSVDDRALNAHVARSFIAALPGATVGTPLRLLEVGAGIGTMIERLVEWNTLSEAVVTAVDEQGELLREAHRRLTRFGEDRGFIASGNELSSLQLHRGDQLICIEFVEAEVIEFARAHHGPPLWDGLLAHAFLDLVDLTVALTALTRLLHEGALLYLTVNFDGTTQFLPEIDPKLDAEIESLYHETMDRRRKDGRTSGDSRTGRRLFQMLPAAQAEILDVGSSDWVVFADNSAYPADEKFFLEWILDSHESALRGTDGMDPARLDGWIAQRRRQVERGELIYITHQLDFLARMTGARPSPG